MVPQTPLHTARVLQEDRDHWDEVKVGERGLGLTAGPRVLEKGTQGDGYSESGSSGPAPCLEHPCRHDCLSGPPMAHGTALPLLSGVPAHSLTQGLWPYPIS